MKIAFPRNEELVASLVMVIIDNLQFYLLKRLKQKQTYIFCFKIVIYFIVYLSKNCAHIQSYSLCISFAGVSKARSIPAAFHFNMTFFPCT